MHLLNFISRPRAKRTVTIKKCAYFSQMLPYDLPLHAGIMPRLVITIEAEPVPGADRYIRPLILTASDASC